jgi:tRNA(Ile)-lysidine synthase
MRPPRPALPVAADARVAAEARVPADVGFAAEVPGAAGPPARFDPAWLGSRLHAMIGPLRGRRLCVAYSGGLDSGSLLAALAALRARERFVLRAVHVDHRLHPQSARWARGARLRAGALRVPCAIVRLTIERGSGESVEAAARESRYRALAARLARGELLLTAHHQEDQLETVLLALMRGSGVRGLAAMNAVTPWAGTLLLRPLLPVTREQLELYARAQALEWSEDPSNADERFDRNYLRRAVLPLIRQRWPAAAATVSRSAAHLAEARALLEQMALAALRDARDGGALRVSVLRRLPLPQRRNALRQWIAERGLKPPDHRRVREICGPMLDARADALPRVSWRGGQLRRYADRLFAFSVGASRQFAAVERWDWRAQPWLSLGSGGALAVVRDRHGDVRLPTLPPLLSVSPRRGGERLQGARGRIALKDLLQAQGLAPWERAAVPLIMHAGRIIAVADLWVDRSYGGRDAPAGERGRFRWRRDGADQADGD